MASKEDSTEIASTTLYEQIDDENFKRLKSIFNSSGRGRRPSAPTNLICNNHLLIQFYYLKDGNKTWDNVADFASSITELQPPRLRALILKTHNKAKHLKDNVLQDFLSVEMDLVGHYLRQVNVSRTELLNETSASRSTLVTLTNGIILDLVSFQKKEDFPLSWIIQAASYLSGFRLDKQSFGNDLKKIQESARKKSKARHRDKQAYSDFHATPYLNIKDTDITVSKVCPPSIPQPATPLCRKRIKLDDIPVDNSPKTTLPYVCEVELSPQSAVENLPFMSASKGNQIRKLKGELEISIKELKLEKEKTMTLNDIISDKTSEFEKQMDQKNQDLESRETFISSLKQDIQHLKLQEEATKSSLERTRKELSRLRHAPYYKRMKRWEKKLTEQEVSLSKGHGLQSQRTIKNLKHKLKKSQTLLSNARQEEKKRKEKVRLNLKLQEVKDDRLPKDDRHEASLRMREGNSNKFTRDVVKCVIELMGRAEVSGKNCGSVIDIVVRNLFAIKLDSKDLPSERSSLRYADKGHVLAKRQLAETLLQASNVDLHSDGTTRDHSKVVGHQLSTDGGQLLSCGFAPVCREDTDTLIDVAFNLLKELADLYPENEIDAVFQTMLKNITGLMSDRASVMKSFNKAFEKQRNETLVDVDGMEFLHCNAHFLLGMSSAADKVLKQWEKEQEEKIGRDCADKFKRFSSNAENAGARYIRTACDILGPRGDEKNGCKDSWEAFCSMQDLHSLISSFRGNRFNNLFQAAASLHHHRREVIDFLKNFMPSLNLKQESVLYDAECDNVDAIIISLGIIYQKITGPYWILIGRDITYLDFFMYVTEMHDSLKRWEADASQLAEDQCPPLFGITVDSNVFPGLYHGNSTNKHSTVTLLLQRLCAQFLVVVERQLCDFLPGGKYHDVKDEQQIDKMKHSKITNLIGEACFGDLDFSIFKRRHASLHHHSTMNMLKRNKTSVWFDTKSEKEQDELLKLCSERSEGLRKAHQVEQSSVLSKQREILAANRLKKERKEAQLAARKKKLSESVHKHGGPCQRARDVDILLGRFDSNTEKLHFLKEEIRFQKIVLGFTKKHLKLCGSIGELASNLKAHLGDEELPSAETTMAEFDTDEEAEADEEAIINDAQFGSFSFSNQGQFIAVYFDNDFYIGQVLSVATKEQAEVTFLEKCRLKKNVFRWSKSDVETISAAFVFDWDFEVTTTNGRMWSISTLERFIILGQKYKVYKELYC